MIPKILHQVWLGGGQPAYHEAFQRNWRRLHPDWEYRLWRDDDVRALGIQRLLDSCANFASRSNVVRLAVVNAHGGVYADCDVDWVKNLQPLLNASAFAAQEIPGSYCNAIFGATSRHAWIEYQLARLPAYVLKRPPWGPALMTEACSRCSITTYPSAHFYPYLYNVGPFPTAQFPDSYAVHHWSLSWTDTDRSERCAALFGKSAGS